MKIFPTKVGGYWTSFKVDTSHLVPSLVDWIEILVYVQVVDCNGNQVHITIR